ncbi:MAG: branched-chain amino acid ABC transporter substrate-binding protein [Terracidiphilus sp.]
MIAGVSWVWWLGFHAVVAALLLADFLFSGASGEESAPPGLQGRDSAKIREQARAWVGAAAFALAAAAFAVWVALTQGRRPALEFVAGYTIEASLSVDNLLIFLVLFQGFEISRRRQHKALLWGVWGAVVLRAAFISAGVTLLKRFDWISWIFGLFLLYAAWRLVRSGSTHAVIPEWIRRLQPAKGSLLPVILAVEFTDLLFATDSIPAVLAVTHNPFVAYTSNIAAILGLRSLYFALAATLDRFRYLHFGLSAILAFVAFKMLAARWIEVPILPSLAVIGAILAVCAVASWLAKGGKTNAGEQGTGNRE